MPPQEEHSWGASVDLAKKYASSESAQMAPLRGAPPQRLQPKIIALVIRYSGGRITNEAQATYVLLAFVALALLVTFFLFTSGGANPAPPQADVERALREGEGKIQMPKRPATPRPN